MVLDEDRQVNYGGNPVTQQSKDSMYYDETETNSYSFEEIKNNLVLSSHQSPKLKVLPTPKAIQPGFGFEMGNPTTTENEQESRIRMISTMQNNNSGN